MRTRLAWRRRGNWRGALDLALSLLVWGASAPLAFVANILIARTLGATGYGQYMVILSGALLLSGLAACGVGPVLTREIATASEDTARARVKMGAVVAWSLRFTGWLSIFAMLIFVLALAFLPSRGATSWGTMVAGALIIPFSVLCVIASGVLAGRSRVAKSLAVRNPVKNTMLVIGALILLILGQQRVTEVLLLQAASFGGALILAVYWLRYELPNASLGRLIIEGWTSVPKVDHRIWRTSSLHFLSISVAMLVLLRLDVIVVDVLAGEHEAGLFGAAARAAQIAQVAGLAWAAWLQPKMAERVSRKDFHAVKRSIKIGLIGAGGMTALIFVAGWLLAPAIITLFGPAFEASTWSFRWLLVGYVAWGGAIPFYAFLTMSGRESALSRLMWLQLVLTLVASWPLIRARGIVGAAWAWGGGMTVANMLVVVAGITSVMRMRKGGALVG